MMSESETLYSNDDFALRYKWREDASVEPERLNSFLINKREKDHKLFFLFYVTRTRKVRRERECAHSKRTSRTMERK